MHMQGRIRGGGGGGEVLRVLEHPLPAENIRVSIFIYLFSAHFSDNKPTESNF